MTNWKPSDAEVDAAAHAIYLRIFMHQGGIGDPWDKEGDDVHVAHRDFATAALIAAHDAAPEPDTTEFEAALHRLVSRAIAYGRGTAEHDAVDVPFQRLIDMYKERR